MNEAESVDGLDGEDELGDVESGEVLRKLLLLDEEAHHVPARDVLHDEEQVRLVLRLSFCREGDEGEGEVEVGTWNE